MIHVHDRAKLSEGHWLNQAAQVCEYQLVLFALISCGECTVLFGLCLFLKFAAAF